MVGETAVATYPDLPELPGVAQQDLVHLRLGLDHPLPRLSPDSAVSITVSCWRA